MMNRLGLRNKLVLSVSTLVIVSGLIISVLETRRFSKNLHEAAVRQGEDLTRALALEATNKILLNDLAALQHLFSHQLRNNPSMAYLFIVRENQILAHTFPGGVPIDLVSANAPRNEVRGNFRRIVNDAEYYLDFAWPIFSGKAGILRMGLSERPYRSKIAQLWLHMTAMTLSILVFAITIGFYIIRKITGPLSALAEAAENLDEKNPGPIHGPETQDEVGRLTTSINKMATRFRSNTRRLSRHTQELDRAHRQTKSAFQIIRKIWRQNNLKDASAYLIWKFQEIVTCKDLVLFIFSQNGDKRFVFFNGKLKTLDNAEFDAAVPILTNIDNFSFVKKHILAPRLTPEMFNTARHVATFPINHERQLLGALLIPCPDQCQCNVKALNVIRLILDHASGAIKRAACREEELQDIKSRLERTKKFCGIVGKDPKMEAIYKLIEDIAPTDTTVLVQGDSGTGKELVARAIHQKSLRRDKPFVVINCSAYPATLLESELFGHEKGAFTGAIRKKIGRFEQAHKGTVFLDEIGEIPPSAQIKLLRVLQTQKFERVGGEQTLKVDVRILAATNKDLLQQVKQGDFREDLYYRLNVIPIQVPPLKQRRNDIPLQARYFMHRFAAEQGKEITDFNSEAMRLLLDYEWPGNVRELENCVEHTVVLARGGRIEVSDLPSALQHANASTRHASQGGDNTTLQKNEARLLIRALEESSWNKKQAALRLGISRNTLYRKLKKYRIIPPTIH